MDAPIIYDQHGRPHKRSSGRLSRAKAILLRLKHWPGNMRVLLTAMITVLGLVIGIESVLPILALHSQSVLDPDNPHSVQFSIAYSGRLPIEDVSAGCIQNKNIYSHLHTIKTQTFTMTEEHMFGRLKTGEAFTVECGQVWRLLINRLKTHGFLILGDSLRMQFDIDHGGRVTYSEDQSTTPGNMMEYSQYPLTNTDIDIIVKYKIPFLGYRFQKRLRFITKETSDKKLQWVPMPDSTPVMADAPGFIFTVGGPGSTLNRH